MTCNLRHHLPFSFVNFLGATSIGAASICAVSTSVATTACSDPATTDGITEPATEEPTTSPAPPSASPPPPPGAAPGRAPRNDDGPTDHGDMICDAIESRSACEGPKWTCDEGTRCLAALMLPASAKAFAECVAAPSCKGEDECFFLSGVAADGSASQYFTTCSERYSACDGAFESGFCDPSVFAFGAGPGATACLTQPCGHIEYCFQSLPPLQAAAACK